MSTTLARSARLSGELQELVDEVTGEELEACRGPWSGTLSVAALQRLPSAGRRSLLRHWIRQQGGDMPGSRHLFRIERECLQSRQDAAPLVQWRQHQVRRFRDGLFLLRSQPPHDAAQRLAWTDLQPLELPHGLGRLVLEPSARGVSVRAWHRARAEVGFRRGGERCRPAGDAHHRSLKKLMQTWSIPPWLRDRQPLIYLDGQLAAVPGHCVCEPFQAGAGEEGLCVRWLAEPH